MFDEQNKVIKIIKFASDITAQVEHNLATQEAVGKATRAGEHGRGFAVVADEMRSLASRTNTSTLEIDEMVKTNQDLTQDAMDRMRQVQEQAHQGSQLINQTAAVIEEIRQGADNVSRTVAALGRAG